MKNLIIALGFFLMFFGRQADAQTKKSDSTVSFLFNIIKTEVDPVIVEIVIQKMEQQAVNNQSGNAQSLLNYSRGYAAEAFARAGLVEKAQHWMARIEDQGTKEQTVLGVVRNLIAANKLSDAENILKPYLAGSAGSVQGTGSAFSAQRPDAGAFAVQYGVILYRRGEYQKALPYLAPSKVNGGNNFGGSSELYALALIGAGQDDLALAEVNKLFARPGTRSAELKAGARKLFFRMYGNHSYFEQLMDSVAKVNRKHAETKISKYKMSQPAPSFVLRSATGKTASLESLKGKTVFIDFWATWCQPCVASFPAMQKAVDYYKNDTSVVFLFVHTSEKSKTPTEDAVRLVKNRKNDFDVYMDLKDSASGMNPVMSGFKVSGLPTKFVIDKNGMIRFRHAGYISEEEGLEEVKAMIEMARS